jgi:hypothetical protein
LPPYDVKFKQPKNEVELEDNPFLYLGYGVNAYFSTMLHMVKMLLVITLFTMPMLAVYSGNDTKALKDLANYSVN